jgi:malonyl-CoA O-methyltransferase
MSTIDAEKISLVLIHGWGCDQASWQPLIPELEKFFTIISIDLPGFGHAPMISDYSLENILSNLIDQIPDGSWVMGWSLGGMLAIQLAHRYPQKISGVVTLAANAKFVADSDYPDAMPLQVNQDFNLSFVENPTATLKLFSGLLAQGAENERDLLKQIRKMLQSETVNANWYGALLLLANIDNRKVIAEINKPCLHLLADSDSLVPASAASCLKKLNSQHQVEVIERSSHALHWCYPELLFDLIQKFILSSRHSGMIEVQQQFKYQVAKKFSKAASTYEQAAEVQRISGGRLLNDFLGASQLPESSVVMDLGCGTGFFSGELQERFNSSSIVGVDLSFDMLSAAHQRSSGLFVGGDAEKLPFSDNSIDLIYSNFALQWCFDLSQLFDELYRVLKPGGELIFTTLGNQSLYELRAAWNLVDDRQHVNRFVDKPSIVALLESRFSQVKVDAQLLLAQFDNVHDLLHSLKSVGATYHTASEKGLMGRKKLARLTEAYEEFREQGKLPLTYDVIFARAVKRAIKGF